MDLSVGIVGLPNVGKSTLFSAITGSDVPSENYPFCTIDPNVGIVSIPDHRIQKLSNLSQSEKNIPSVIEFVDIAGLVKGASDGEGLGNKFLSNIRATSVIAHVVRCFDSSDVIHVQGSVDPLRDVDIIDTELLLADMAFLEKRIETQKKKIKSNDKDEVFKLTFFERLLSELEKSNPIRMLTFTDKEQELLQELQLITSKQVIYVANVDESGLNNDSDYTQKLRDYAQSKSSGMIKICSQLEAELSTLSDDEKSEYLVDCGLDKSGLDLLAESCFDLLGLQTYLTTGPKETRSWTIKKGTKAPQAAGVIHTDFEKGFIRANIISYDVFIQCGSLKKAKEEGVLRVEGKDYVMQDGDVVEFLFNV